MKKKITIVVPVYNEEKNISKFITMIRKTLSSISLKNYKFKVLFINDGSTDSTWNLIKKFSKFSKLIGGLNLQKNYGKELAMEFSINFVQDADSIILMDGDLQHPPHMIKKLIIYWEKGYNIVRCIKNYSKNISLFKKLTSFIYYNLFGKYVFNSTFGESDFRILDKKVINQLSMNQNGSGLFRDHINSLGFRSHSIFFEPDERYAGEANYSYFKLIKLSIDNIFINTSLPIRIIGIFGLLISIIFVILISYMLNNYLTGNSLILTPTSFLVTLNLALTGLLILILVILAIFLQRIHKKIFQNNKLYYSEKINIKF